MTVFTHIHAGLLAKVFACQTDLICLTNMTFYIVRAVQGDLLLKLNFPKKHKS